MLRAGSARAPILIFSSGAALVYAVAVWIALRLPSLARPDLVASGLTIDLTILVPLLYYVLVVRRRGAPAVTLLPVFLVSVALAHLLIPQGQRQVLRWVEYGAVAAELALIGFVLYKGAGIVRGFRERTAVGLDFHDALRDATRPVLGRPIGDALAYEIAVIRYAIAGWRAVPIADVRAFPYHRASGYVPLATAIAVAAGIETVAVHLLVRMWSPATAWALSGLGIYALVWIVGDTHAVRLRPVRLTQDTLHVRLGLRWSVDLPIEAIAGVSTVDRALPRRTRGYLKAVLLGAPNRRVELSQAVSASGPYGLTRTVTVVDLRLDEPERFDRTIEDIA